MSHRFINVYNYNEYTKKLPHWDPNIQKFDSINDFFEYIKEQSNYFILGPENVEKLKFIWRFHIICTKDNISLNSLDMDFPIKISINNKLAKINYTAFCSEYMMKDLMHWAINLCKNMGCNEFKLTDTTEKGFYFSLLHKLWIGETYYEIFENELKSSANINELNSLIDELYKFKWENFNISNAKWDKFQNLFKFIYPVPFLAFMEFSPKNYGIFYDALRLLDSEEQPCYQILQQIRKILTKN